MGLAHFYDDVGNVMANGEVFTGRDMTVAMRQDLLAEWPLGSTARLTSACGIVTATVTDVMPVCGRQPEVVMDVSPAVCELLFCGGCGYNSRGVAYGEEFVLVERADSGTSTAMPTPLFSEPTATERPSFWRYEE